ncbi:aminotransferase class V-fold PLP-dependent enzyme [Brenneria goodwinii]|uniref:aminotransferase class V-fold PLP-dependent enzyme n=1 Tax=Brenneria goodwinii TaxID=1109412 RepID=UPI0036E32FFB
MSTALPKKLIPSDPRFGCGPSLIQLADLTNLQAKGPHLLGTSHRKEPVRALCREIQNNIKTYLSIPNDYSIVFGNGGATLLFDMIGLGLVRSHICHYVCGEFSEKWFKASRRIPWIQSDRIAVNNGFANTFLKNTDADVIAITLNETSTGVMNTNIPNVDQECLLAIDATSAAGQISCNLSLVDVFFFSPQKVFASEGGLFIAIISPKAKLRISEIAAKSNRYIPVFADWQIALNNSEQQQTYNTPAVVTLFLFTEQLRRLNEIGFPEIERQSKEKADFIYQWAESREYLSPYVIDCNARSITVATIDVSGCISVDKLTSFLEQHHLVYGIEGYRALKRNQLRIALFPNISFENLKKLTLLIDYLIESGDFSS